MFCSRCGTPVTEGSGFCSHCGAPVAPTAAPFAPTATAPTPAMAVDAAPATSRYGGFWRRFWAFSIDRLLVGMVVLPDRKSTRLNSSHIQKSRMPSSA